MLLGKPPDKFEVYNDLDGELYNLFCVIKDRMPEFLLELDLLPINARDNFKECLRFYNGGNDPGIHLPTQEEIIDRLIPQEWGWELKETMRKRVENRAVRQAAAFFTRMRTSYSSNGKSFACQPFNIRTTFEQIREMNRRIENVVIENQSFEVLIPHYDRPDSFFYLDPPYVASEHFYEAEFGWEQHVRLRDILAGMVNSGFSDCTLRITYQATMDADNSMTYGDSGNPNEVVLTWKRSNSSYYDTLIDDAHIYTYGIDLTKLFSDGNGNFENVEFIVHNDTDNYFVKAELNAADGIYYVVDHVEAEADATHFIPVTSNGTEGKVIIKGLEDDTYTITEVRTDNGYTLLKDDIEVIISQVETVELCDIYAEDVVGLIQNDPRYAESIINEAISKGYIKTDGNLADVLNNMPQKHLEHHLLTASATVDGNDVNMLEDNGSVNAHAPLTVVNTRGFDLPETGDRGTLLFSVFGILAMAGSMVSILLLNRKKAGK